MRRAARVDANHGEIVKALRAMGCSVESLAQIGSDVPDLLVGFRGWNGLLEVKNSKNSPSARKLSPGQKRWHEAWNGQVNTVTTWRQACELVCLYAAEAGARRVA